jgi:hypothetical protein
MTKKKTSLQETFIAGYGGQKPQRSQGKNVSFKHPNPYPKKWLPGPDGKRPIDKS